MSTERDIERRMAPFFLEVAPPGADETAVRLGLVILSLRTGLVSEGAGVVCFLSLPECFILFFDLYNQSHEISILE